MTRPVLRAVLAGLVVALASPAGAAPVAQQVFAFDGRGYGHGVGMAQVSAQAMALSGLGREQILNHFYPGTGRASRSATLAVAVWEAEAPTGSVTVALPSGGRVSAGARVSEVPPGSVLVVSYDDGGYHVREPAGARPVALRAAFVEESPTPAPLPTALPSSTPSPSVAPPSPTPSPSTSRSPSPSPSASGSATPTPSATRSPYAFDSAEPVTITPTGGGVTQVRDTGRAYRGQVQALSRQGFRLVNLVDLETYLQGLGEVPKSWQPAALQVQAVAARTYALRATGQGRPLGYDLCDDTRCQVYIGATNEGAATTAAAQASRGEVVTYGGSLASTYYSANAGGRTASPGEGFGGESTSPYLPSNVVAPGDVDAWTLTPSVESVASRLGYAGRLTGLSIVGRGPSGRVTLVRLDGSGGPVQVSGVSVARALSLRSTLFSVRLTTGVAQELAAPGSVPTQLPPGLLAQELAAPSSELPAASTATPTALVPTGDAERGVVGWLAGAMLAVTAALWASVATKPGALHRGRREEGEAT